MYYSNSQQLPARIQGAVMSAPPPLPPMEQPPSTDHQSVTHKFRILGEFGEHKFWLTMAWDENGRPSSVHVVIDKWGSTTRGFVNAWCSLVNHCLDRDTNVEEIIAMFKSSRFEPSGMVKGPKGMPSHCTSILNLIVCALELEFKEKKVSA